jgi:hypothetical protein
MKMRVRLSSNYATPTASGAPGDVLSLPRNVAEDLIEKGYATKLEGGRRSTPAAAVTTPSSDKAPSGNIKKVLAWVGDDPARAAIALEAEQARAKTRASLVDSLSAIITGAQTND